MFGLGPFGHTILGRIDYGRGLLWDVVPRRRKSQDKEAGEYLHRLFDAFSQEIAVTITEKNEILRLSSDTFILPTKWTDAVELEIASSAFVGTTREILLGISGTGILSEAIPFGPGGAYVEDGLRAYPVLKMDFQNRVISVSGSVLPSVGSKVYLRHPPLAREFVDSRGGFIDDYEPDHYQRRYMSGLVSFWDRKGTDAAYIDVALSSGVSIEVYQLYRVPDSVTVEVVGEVIEYGGVKYILKENRFILLDAVPADMFPEADVFAEDVDMSFTKTIVGVTDGPQINGLDTWDIEFAPGDLDGISLFSGWYIEHGDYRLWAEYIDHALNFVRVIQRGSEPSGLVTFNYYSQRIITDWMKPASKILVEIHPDEVMSESSVLFMTDLSSRLIRRLNTVKPIHIEALYRYTLDFFMETPLIELYTLDPNDGETNPWLPAWPNEIPGDEYKPVVIPDQTVVYKMMLTERGIEVLRFASMIGMLDYWVTGFKVGEGGWVDSGGGRVPKNPDGTLNDLDCIENPTNYPESSRFHFDGQIESVSYDSVEDSVSIQFFVNQDEANVDDAGHFPEFYEAGVFDRNGDLLIHMTFPMTQKVPGLWLRFRVEVKFP